MRNRDCIAPLAGSLVGRIPESMISVALVLLVRQSTGSYVAAGLATGALPSGQRFRVRSPDECSIALASARSSFHLL